MTMETVAIFCASSREAYWSRSTARLSATPTAEAACNRRPTQNRVTSLVRVQISEPRVKTASPPRISGRRP